MIAAASGVSLNSSLRVRQASMRFRSAVCASRGDCSRGTAGEFGRFGDTALLPGSRLGKTFHWKGLLLVRSLFLLPMGRKPGSYLVFPGVIVTDGFKGQGRGGAHNSLPFLIGPFFRQPSRQKGPWKQTSRFPVCIQ